MEDLKTKFLEMQGIDNYQRIGVPHSLPIYIGMDTTARYSLFFVTETAPDFITSSKIISVFIGQRQDGNFGITFSLSDRNYLDLFVHFCEDLIEASREIRETGKAADFLCSRYAQWQKAFSRNNNGLLSFAEIKGLVGELFFLQMKMIPLYGEEKALDSWIGPDMADQDFVCDDTWFEVKSTVSGSTTIQISSVEQLDINNSGHLAVVRLDKTSESDSARLTLNNVSRSVCSVLSSELLRQKLKNILLRLGYYEDKEYDRYCFHYNGMSLYRVNSFFPCARKKDFPAAVQNVKYELSLPAVDSFKEE
jgi:hypothetical protein